MSMESFAREARVASRALRQQSGTWRAQALGRMGRALMENAEMLLEANALDVADAEAAVVSGVMRRALADRLPLSRAKLETLADGMRTLAERDDPVGRVRERMEVGPGLELTRVDVPIGVLLVIFEARPDVLPQLAALAVRTGNALLLKGGTEAYRSNLALHRVLNEALGKGAPSGTVTLLETRTQVAELLSMDAHIDLVVPRGSSELVRTIQERTRIPVLGHAEGVCHVFVDREADPTRARAVVLDAKVDYPAACNAMESLLLHRALLADGRAEELLETLRGHGVRLWGGPRAVEGLCLPPASDLGREYGDLQLTVEIVDDVEQAIDHVHRWGSGHTESVVTESDVVARRFLSGVDSACVFHNASTRFADGYRFGLGAEVGISTGRLHARGPVGVDGLLTEQWRLVGQGDAVGPFSSGKRHFTHRRLT